VTGKVAQVTIRPTVNFLNLDKPFPNSPFAVVIFPRQRQLFGDWDALRGKSIEIRGRIKNYKDKPEIILDTANQLTVLNSTNSITPPDAPAVPPPTNGFPEIM
jgi:DNA/RNA endonuclease YhcR with UshA esterase domain